MSSEQYFPVVLFILYKVLLTFESVDEILKCDRSEQHFFQYYFSFKKFLRFWLAQILPLILRN